jgi:hypothetical protein
MIVAEASISASGMAALIIRSGLPYCGASEIRDFLHQVIRGKWSPSEEIEIQRWPVPKLQRYCSAAIQRKLFRCLRQLRPKPQLGWRQNIDIGVEWNGEPPLGSLLVTARKSVVRLAIVL